MWFFDLFTRVFIFHWINPSQVHASIWLSRVASQQALLQDENRPNVNNHEAGIVTPLAGPCASYEFPDVICIREYGSRIQGDFERKVRNVLGDSDTYGSTVMPHEPSFDHVSNASFLVFDQQIAPTILGTSPSVDFMFKIEDVSHEGPLYVPETNELYFSRLQRHYLPQLVVDLNADPPALSERLADPPIYAGAGARYHKGLIYYVTISGHENLQGHHFRPGLYTLNITSGKSEALLNNYYGYYFNGADDLDIDSNGIVWFTDNNYGRPCHVNTQAPQINVGTYRFDPSTGYVSLVEDTLTEPNGVAFSPDQRTLYLTDTGAGEAIISPHISPAPSITLNSTKQRTVYAYDVSPDRLSLRNKRPIYYAMDYVPDGIKVSKEGYIVTATGHGVDVLTGDGRPLVRALTNFTVINMAFTGDEVWAVGKGGVARIRWDLRAPEAEWS